MEAKGIVSKLVYELLRVTQLPDKKIERMYYLMTQNYNHVEYGSFVNDLYAKQLVGLLIDETGILQGFTTFGINLANTESAEFNILFSGDTIISPAYWGTQELGKGWCATVGGLIAGAPDKKWYWFLLSKGHRTYMYLPLFFERYYPSVEKNEEADLFKLVDRCASAIYADAWKPERGVICFDKSHGELIDDLTSATFRKGECNKHVQYFLDKNPGFTKGDELACMAELKVDNFKRFTKISVLKGMRTPITI